MAVDEMTGAISTDRRTLATTLAVVLALVAVLRAWSPAIAAPPAQSSVEAPQLPGFESVQAEAYALYAPNQELLRSARGPLDAAVDRFREYFGEAPPQIAVVVFETPEQASAASIGDLRSRGLPVLPWIAPQFLETRAFPNLGIIVRQTSARGGVTVVGQLSIDPPDGLRVQQGDRLVAFDGEPIQSIEDVQARYDRAAVGSTIELTIDRQGGEQVQAFAKPPSRYRIVEGDGGLDPASVLSHEAGHVYFVNYVDRRLGRPALGTGPSYGHPSMPDWFDEAVALLLEPPAMQAQRLSELRRQLQSGASLVPLDHLFEMSHPRAPSQADGSSGAGPTGAEQIVPGIGLSVGGGGDATNEDGSLTDTYAIYYQTSALMQFLREREGPAFIGQIADGLIGGQSMSATLAGARTLPSDPDELRQALREWVLQPG